MVLSIRRRMANRSAASRVLLLLLTGILATPYPLSADPVTDWNLTTVTAVTNSTFNPVQG